VVTDIWEEYITSIYFYPDDAGDMFVQNVGNYLQEYTASQPRSQQSMLSPPCKLQTSLLYTVVCFREGVVSNLPAKAGKGSVVNCGLLKDVIVDKSLTPGIRVTVKLLQSPEGSKKLRGIIVPPSLPSAETGVYWGYTVRIARSLGEVFSQAPYTGGYDLTIGTSERGDKIDDIPQKGLQYSHAIVVFGGLHGLEAALDNDEVLTVDDPALVFDHYLNTCPGQGSRTIRTEEAILISLAELRTKLIPKLNSS
jgi:predicted SPOUT superfamily RNA methylase MTH1